MQSTRTNNTSDEHESYYSCKNQKNRHILYSAESDEIMHSDYNNNSSDDDIVSSDRKKSKNAFLFNDSSEDDQDSISNNNSSDVSSNARKRLSQNIISLTMTTNQIETEQIDQTEELENILQLSSQENTTSEFGMRDWFRRESTR